ncbi:hypothetical protein LTR41_005636 [Exophiala xenobiotica]|nr:hypothetical protein LTR41_005636 [Exophiala xenobiotica]
MLGEAQGSRYIFKVVKGQTIASTAHYIVPTTPTKPFCNRMIMPSLQAKGAFDVESERTSSAAS